jgi:2-polyprenyl-3-methyl-5-hydroxy-6-metoxy-1,4-benzoquinol methylase
MIGLKPGLHYYSIRWLKPTAIDKIKFGQLLYNYSTHKLKTAASVTASEDISAKTEFEDLYLTVRRKEGRFYTDEQVSRLPEIDEIHPYFHEWQMRARSANRLISYLQKKNRPLSILEIGCGNGWLSAKMEEMDGALVTGMDANKPEIEQARRVFKNSSVRFIYNTFNPESFGNFVKFDVIVFAASFQYFPSARAIIDEAGKLLNAGGEIHILDTHFYDTEQAKLSAGRSKNYYTTMGVAEMAGHYFHHSLNCFDGYDHKAMFNPKNWLNRITKKDVFYWIRIGPTQTLPGREGFKKNQIKVSPTGGDLEGAL